jgi:hypothetical protein
MEIIDRNILIESQRETNQKYQMAQKDCMYKPAIQPGVDAGFWSGGSIIGFSSLSDLNPLTNRVLNKNIKIISLYIKNNKK